MIDKDHPALLILRLARDEAHRFAIEYHKNIRRKNLLYSSLANINGLDKDSTKALQKLLSQVDFQSYTHSDLSSYLKIHTPLTDKVIYQIINAVLE